jgi:hypothetical protein
VPPNPPSQRTHLRQGYGGQALLRQGFLRRRGFGGQAGAHARISSPLNGKPLGRASSAVAVVAWALVAVTCREQEPKPAHVIVRNPDYLVVRPIKRNADAEHTSRVELPYSGAGYGFASSSALLDMNSFDLGAVGFAGGRTSVVGEATIWLPLTAEGSRRLEAWSTLPEGDFLGIFLKGKLVAAPQIKSRMGGGIPLRVASKSEGDLVLKELRNGGATD